MGRLQVPHIHIQLLGLIMATFVGSFHCLTFWTRTGFGRSTRMYKRSTSRIATRSTTRGLSADRGNSYDKTNNEKWTNNNMTGWTVEQAYETAVQKLIEANVVEPEASVPHLMAAAIGLDWETGYRQVMQEQSTRKLHLTVEQASNFNNMLNRRLLHEPIQYILEQWDFLHYTVAIRQPLLCPRPETEELVLRIVKESQEKQKKPLRILDVGCGTGVIGLSLADQLPNAEVYAIDIEPIAVSTSLENAHRIFSNSEMIPYHVTLASAADFQVDEGKERFDLVVSNPPYIPTDDYQGLSPDVIDYESRDALEGGEDGLTVIRHIIDGLPRWCHPGAICWMEVDPTHPELLRSYLSSIGGDTMDSGKVKFVSAHEDMFGKQRFVKLQFVKDEQ